MTTTIHRHYLEQYLTFYYEYLPKLASTTSQVADASEEEEEEITLERQDA